MKVIRYWPKLLFTDTQWVRTFIYDCGWCTQFELEVINDIVCVED